MPTNRRTHGSSHPGQASQEATGSPGVDIGGGTTETVISFEYNKANHQWWNEFDEAIVNYIKKEYSLMIGERTTEEIK